MSANPFFPYGAPGLIPFQQFCQSGTGMAPFQTAAPGMYPYPTTSNGFSPFVQPNLGSTYNLGQGSYEPATFVQPGSVQIGVPTEVVHIEGHPLSMYLQLCNEDLISSVQNELRMISEDQNFSVNYLLAEPPKIGNLYCAKWSIDNSFYRAKVEELDPVIIVRFVDFGNVDIVDETQIFRLKDSLLAVPFQAVHCKLKGLESLATDPGSVIMDEDQRDHLARILRSGRLYAVFQQNSGQRQAGSPTYEVDLISHINVSKYIVDYKLIADVEQVKQELEDETNFFRPGFDPATGADEHMQQSSSFSPPEHRYSDLDCQSADSKHKRDVKESMKTELYVEPLPPNVLERSILNVERWLEGKPISEIQQPDVDDWELPPQQETDVELDSPKLERKIMTSFDSKKLAKQIPKVEFHENLNGAFCNESKSSKSGSSKAYSKKDSSFKGHSPNHHLTKDSSTKKNSKNSSSKEFLREKGFDEDYFESSLDYVKPSANKDGCIEYYLCEKAPLLPNMFYILPFDNSILPEIEQFTNLPSQMSEYFSHHLPPPNWHTVAKSLLLGTYLAVDLKEEDWQRGELVSFVENGRQMKVFLFDYGDTKIVDINDVRRLPKRFGLLPKMAVPCKLYNICPPGGCKSFSEEAIGEFQRILTTEMHDLMCDDLTKFPLQIQISLISERDGICFIQSHLVNLGLASYNILPVIVNQNLTEKVVTEPDLTDNFNSTERGDRLEDTLENYDPAKEDFTSIRNNLHFRQDNVEMVNEGFAIEAARNERICKFYSANGRCNRGDDCRFIHVQASKDFHGDGPLVVSHHNIELPNVGAKVSIKITSNRHPHCFTCILPHGKIDLAKVTDFRELENQLSDIEKEDLPTFLSNLNKYYSKIKTTDFKSAPRAGEIVVARNESDNRWYRSRIIDLAPDSVQREYNYNVFLVDFGVTVNVDLLNLRVIQPQFLHLPFQAVECGLDGISPIGDVWSNDAKDFFNSVVKETNLLLAEVKSDEPFLVDLYASIKRKNLNVGDLMVKKKLAIKNPSANNSQSDVLPG